jgi:hypothetical protein
MKFDELCNKLMVENVDNQKRIEKEDIEYLVYFKKTANQLGEEKRIGDPEWGGWTQEEHDKWRKDAESYAEEWGLDLRDWSRENRISVEEADDDDLRFEIRNNLEQREESFFWKVFEKLGLKNPSNELQQEIANGMDDLTYVLEKNPREFDKGLEELNNKILSLK